MTTLARDVAVRRNGFTAGQAVRLIVLIAGLLLVLYPLAWVIGSSFKSDEEIASNISVLRPSSRWSTTPRGGTASTSASPGSSSTAP